MERKVTVWGQSVTVSVYQKSKSVWIASGDYLGKDITTQDRTASTALKRWKEAATYAGN